MRSESERLREQGRSGTRRPEDGSGCSYGCREGRKEGGGGAVVCVRKCSRQHRGTYPPGVLDVLGAVRGGWWVGAVAGVVAGGRGGGGRRRALGIRVSGGAEVHRC